MRVVASIVLLACSFGCGGQSQPTDQDRIVAIGLRTDAMDVHAAHQRDSNWCWAACIQAVLSTQGVTLDQADIVRQAFGSTVDVPATLYVIAEHLTGQFVTADGEPVWLEAAVYEGAPTFPLLKMHLDAGVPLIVGVTNAGSTVGHAVLVTAAIYERTETELVLHTLVVRDPYEPNGGKREMGAGEFERIFAHVVLAVM